MGYQTDPMEPPIPAPTPQPTPAPQNNKPLYRAQMLRQFLAANPGRQAPPMGRNPDGSIAYDPSMYGTDVPTGGKPWQETLVAKPTGGKPAQLVTQGKPTGGKPMQDAAPVKFLYDKPQGPQVQMFEGIAGPAAPPLPKAPGSALNLSGDRMGMLMNAIKPRRGGF